MNTRELMELSALDALGLLDEQERESFEMAFQAAAPEVQAHVRREQARFAVAEHLLPDVEPPAGLRARVIAKVREAMAMVSPDDTGVLASVAGAVPSRNTGPFWRMMAIGSATAAVVLGGLYLSVVNELDTQGSLIQSNALALQIQQLGPRSQEILLSDQLMPVNFAPSAPSAAEAEGMRAQLLFDPVTGEALLLCDGLPVADGNYKLVVRSSDSDEVFEHFSATGGLVPVLLEDVQQEYLCSFAITGPLQRGGVSQTGFEVGDG